MHKLFYTLSLFIALSASGQKKFTISPLPFSATEVNAPGRGAQYWHGVQWDNVKAPQVPNGITTGYTGYLRFEWDELEKEKGVYLLSGPYPSLEFWIRHFVERGESFAFGGIMTVCDGCGNTSYPDGGQSLYPYYLHQMMQQEPVPDWKTNAGYWIPNWNSEAYLSRFEALMDTVAKFIESGSFVPTKGPNSGKRVYYKDVLDFVDIRGFGNFGEWHTYPFVTETPAQALPSSATLKRIIDITLKTFPNSPLTGVMNIFDCYRNNAEIKPEVAYYLLNISNNYGKIGWRRDNLGVASYDKILANNPVSYNGMRLDTAILNRWKYALITGEPINGGPEYIIKNVPFADLRREVNLYHISGFGNGNFQAKDISKASVRDTLREVFKLTGQRLVLNGGSMSTTLYPNTAFTITLNWRNTGAAPLYQKRWKVRYQLRTSTDSVIQTWTSTFNPYLFLPAGKDSIVSENFILGRAPLSATHKLVVFVEDTTGYFPHHPLALKTPSRNADGSYTLRTNITVTTAPAANTNPNLYLFKEPSPKNRNAAYLNGAPPKRFQASR